MDVAASEFYEEATKTYNLDKKNPKPDPAKNIPSDKLQELYTSMVAKYPIVSIEDPFDQDDTPAWSKFTASIATTTQIVGYVLCCAISLCFLIN